MKIILYFIFSMILVLVNHTVLAEQTQDCTNRSSGSEKRCLTGKKEDEGSKSVKKVLAQSQKKEKVPTLKNTKNNLSNSKSYILQLLQSLAEQRAISSITPLLQDSEPYVRDAALEVLGQLDAKEAIPSIIPLLKDTDSSVRNKAIEVLVQFRAKEAIPSIIPLFQEKDKNVRIKAMAALVQLGAKEAIPAIIPLLKDNESTVRMAAMNTLL